MKLFSTIHNHCTLCDGISTPEEMLEAAIAAGFTDFGMSCHGYAPFDPDYSMPDEETYLNAMQAMKRQYDGRLRLWIGVEEDYFAPSACPEKYDYRIGDVHYAKNPVTGEFVDIDGSVRSYEKAIRELYRGSAMDMVKAYYENMVKVSEKQPTVMGHFDLIVKNNRSGLYFDEESDEYMETAEQALAACLENCRVFEINSGALVKAGRKEPYPAPFLLQKLQKLGGQVTLTADCHNAMLLTAGLDRTAAEAKAAGFNAVLQWVSGSWENVEL